MTTFGLWQVEEETGINLNVEDMIDLTAFLDPSTGCGVFPSPVSCPLLFPFMRMLAKLRFETLGCYCSGLI